MSRFVNPKATTLIIGFLLAASARAQILYVDAAASPGGDGSQATPFVTIQEAVDIVTAGSTVSVAPGSYAGFQAASGVSGPQPYINVVSQGGPEVTHVGPMALDRPVFVFGFDIDGQGGVAVLASSPATLDTCILTNASTGVSSPASFSVWTSTIVHCGVGIEGPTDVTDCIFFANGLDIDSTGLGCSNEWQTWQHPTQGLLTQAFDPLFWDIDNEDLHLRAGSPCLNIGCWVSDIGALSYDPSYFPEPLIYCTSKTSADQCTPSVSTSGELHASYTSAQPFVITASSVSEFKNGMFFFGFAPLALPYQGGYFCIQPPTLRTPLQSSGSTGSACSGQYNFDFNDYIQGTNLPFLEPGLSLFGQFWYRDPAGSFQSARTEAVRFALLD